MKKRQLIGFVLGYKLAMIILCVSLMAIHSLCAQSWFSRAASIDTIEKELSREDADTDAFDPEGMTGLIFAADQGYVDRVKLLLHYGAQVNLHAKNQFHLAPLHYAILNADNIDAFDIARLLLESHADVRATGALLQRNIHGAHPWHLLVNIDTQSTFEKLSKLLLAYGADVNAQTDEGYTLLHLMVEINNEDAARFMLQQFGCLLDLNLKMNGQTALEYAQYLRFPDMESVFDEVEVQSLHYDQDKPYIVDPNGYDPLMVAIIRGNLPEVEKMLQIGFHAKSATRDEYKNSPLQMALLHRNLAVVDLLVRYNADLSYKNAQGRTVLHTLFDVHDRDKQKRIFDALVANDKNRNTLAQIINARDTLLGDTVIHCAVKLENGDLLATLLQTFSEIDLSVKNYDRMTPIELAQKWKRNTMESLLLKKHVAIKNGLKQALFIFPKPWHLYRVKNQSYAYSPRLLINAKIA